MTFSPGGACLRLYSLRSTWRATPTDQIEREIVVLSDFFRAAQIFDIGFQDAIEHVVRRKAVLIGLIGAKFSGRSFGENRRQECDARRDWRS